MIISIGHGNFVKGASMVAVLRPDSSPARQLRRSAEEAGRLINATNGRKTRSIIVLQSGHIILSALQPERLKERLNLSEQISKGSDADRPQKLVNPQSHPF
jgi:regulator of extracellular matrix RemA (YlzA/DUF370 family)